MFNKQMEKFAFLIAYVSEAKFQYINTQLWLPCQIFLVLISKVLTNIENQQFWKVLKWLFSEWWTLIYKQENVETELFIYIKIMKAWFMK